MACETCAGLGFYLDRRCRQKSCDHPKATPPMVCFERPCSCKAGKSRRDALIERIKRQEAFNANWEYSRESSQLVLEAPAVEELAQTLNATNEELEIEFVDQ